MTEKMIAENKALQHELEAIKASVAGYDSPEHAAQVADTLGHANTALQHRLTVAEQLLKRFDTMFSGGICSGPLQDLAVDVRAALKPAADCEHGYSNPTGCPVCQGINP